MSGAVLESLTGEEQDHLLYLGMYDGWVEMGSDRADPSVLDTLVRAGVVRRKKPGFAPLYQLTARGVDVVRLLGCRS